MHYKTSIPARIRSIAAQPLTGTLALLTLCLAVYLPGVLRLPAVDRTEVIWAESTRDMVARGDWLDPRYAGKAQQYRPIGTFWAQGAAATLAGEDEARNITVYRLPGLIAVTLAVLALYWLGTALVGSEAALIAAGLLAVAPLTVLLSQLAIAEGLSLLPATVAMLSLLRIYSRDDSGWREALLFWTALGFGVVVNALLVPILVLATLITLYAMDRDLRWLKRTRPLVGLPLAIALAAPWLIVRAHQDGTTFAGMPWREFLAALGGAQDMKLRAWPGTFVLALLLGFLPGTALIGTAAKELWDDRGERLSRFLLAWVIGYLVYLEAVSSKPGTYMVQAMFPALALAIGRIVVSEDGCGHPPKWHAFVWPSAPAFFPFLLFGAVYVFAGKLPDIAEATAIIVIAGLFILSTRQGREGQLRMWAASGVAALGLLAVTLLGKVLPSIDEIWPSRQIAKIARACPQADIDILGFREPSARFVLKSDVDRQSADSIAETMTDPKQRLTIIEDRWLTRAAQAREAKTGQALWAASHCISAYNVMRGCPLQFRVYETGAAAPCEIPAKFACSSPAASGRPQVSGDCD